jgi:RND family efflux transporter MFP subunit
MAKFSWRRAKLASIGWSALALLGACGEGNRYVEPPPAQVTVVNPVRQPVARYLEATGNAAAVNSGNLVARVEGFVQEINYQDGDVVKKGATLFVIEPEPYRLKLEQNQAAQSGAQAELTKAEAEFKRQADLLQKEVTAQVNYDKALAQRDSDKANLDQAKSNTGQAELNLGYTQVKAPYDGVVTARQVSLGDLVGAGGNPTTLATIVQLEPIYVNFNINEQDIARIRAEMAHRSLTFAELKGKIPVDVGLQTEQGYPHRAMLDYAAPSVDQSTGTLAVRAVYQNAKNALLPGAFVRVRIPLGAPTETMLVPDTALGSDQGGRYLLVVNDKNVVEQRPVTIGSMVGDLRVIENGLKPEDRVIVDGLQRAIPGQKVEPQVSQIVAKKEPDNLASGK